MSEHRLSCCFFSALQSHVKTKAGQLCHEEKARLLKIAKRARKGPFNSILDPPEYKAGNGMVGLSEAVKSSGLYDAYYRYPLLRLDLTFGLSPMIPSNRTEIPSNLMGFRWEIQVPTSIQYVPVR